MKELKQRIKDAGIIQSWLAKKIGVSPVTLNQWLVETRAMPDDKKTKIIEIVVKVEKATA